MESTAKAIGGVKYVRPPSGAFNPLVIATAHALGLKIALNRAGFPGGSNS
jgi:hypothetical protein